MTTDTKNPNKHKFSPPIISIMDALEIAAITLSNNLTITEANSKATTLLAELYNSLRGLTLKELCQHLKIDFTLFNTNCHNTIQFEHKIPITSKLLHKEYYIWQFTLMKTQSNEPYLLCIRNVTPNDRKIHQLETSVHNLRHIINLLPGNIYWTSKNGHFLGCNYNHLRTHGLKSHAEYIEKTYSDLYEKQEIKYIKSINAKVMKTGKTMRIEEQAIKQGKPTITYLSYKVPLRDDRDNIIGLLGISFDITKQKRMQQTINEAKIKEKLLQEKLQAMNTMAASIAHELRTPLATISKGTSVRKFLQRLTEGYNMAVEANLPVTPIRKNLINSIEKSLDIIKDEASSANEIINMLLANLRNLESSDDKFELHSITSCIKTALNRYPFDSSAEHSNVTSKLANDFNFKGEPVLMEHIIFNLLKNALYHIAKTRKGDIQIWLENKNKHNELHFKDTSTGIEPDILPHIFEHFYSQTPNGTGMGLAFCRMAMEKMGGTILCISEVNRFTEFVLSFPKQK